VTIENHDDGFLSGELVEALRAESRLDVVDSIPEGEDAVRTLVIPERFTERVLSREDVVLELRKEPNTSIEAGEAVSVSIFKALIRVVGGLVELEASAIERGVEGLAVGGDSVSGSLWRATGAETAAVESLHVELDSLQARARLVSVSSSLAGRAHEPPPGGFQSSVPGTMVMFVLMSMLFAGTGITAERASGVLRRLGMSPAGKTEVVLGKLLGRVWVACLQILFLLAVGRFAFRITLGNSPVALVALMVAFAFCTGAFSILFGSFFRNPDQVSGFAVITTLAMAALGGCWWPIEVVSRPFQIVAFCLPTGWAIHGIHRIISFGYGLESVGTHIAVLAAFGLLFIILASKRLRWTL
jgi:ABC-type Na+ efflux pump permease subunit